MEPSTEQSGLTLAVEIIQAAISIELSVLCANQAVLSNRLLRCGHQHGGGMERQSVYRRDASFR